MSSQQLRVRQSMHGQVSPWLAAAIQLSMLAPQSGAAVLQPPTPHLRHFLRHIAAHVFALVLGVVAQHHQRPLCSRQRAGTAATFLPPIDAAVMTSG